MKFYNLKCEVPGSLGIETIYDKNIMPWEIRHPHIIFDGWLGAEMLIISSCLLVSDSLMKGVLFNYTGIQGYETFLLEVSDNLKKLQPDVILPGFIWMKVSTKAFSDDIALTFYNGLYNQLIISDRIWQVLNGFDLGNYSLSLAHQELK